jgi:hypothetical protein
VELTSFSKGIKSHNLKVSILCTGLGGLSICFALQKNYDRAITAAFGSAAATLVGYINWQPSRPPSNDRGPQGPSSDL